MQGEWYMKSKKIEELLLSTRTCNALHRVGIHTIEDLLTTQLTDITGKNGVGRKTIEEIKVNINNAVAEINKYIKMRIFVPCKSNEYKLQFATKYTMKEFNTLSIYNNDEGIQEYKRILNWLNDYLYYISNDFDPIEFIEFDVILNNEKVS